MTPLRQGLADYLTLRRSLGYKLDRPEKLLGQFIGYLESLGASTVTVSLALAWARLPLNGGSNWWSHRLSVVRQFALYLRPLDPRTEVPAPDLLPWSAHRATPYLYTDDEVAALIAAAESLRFSIRTATYQALIGLLAVTGMRVGEAIRLDRDDFDPVSGVVLVRWTKFNKTRELPLHPSTVSALRRYLSQRAMHISPTRTPAFFVSPAGARLLYCNVHSTFRNPRRPGRAGATFGLVPTSHPRPTPQFRRPHFARGIPRRPRPRGPDGVAVYLPRPRRPGRHILVPLRRARTDGHCRPTPGGSPG